MMVQFVMAVMMSIMDMVMGIMGAMVEQHECHYDYRNVW